jgi:G patch domain-containing protein 1
MDEEDIATQEESQKLQIAGSFSNPTGNNVESVGPGDNLAFLLHGQEQTVGFRLLRKMGWKDGQGVGPKVHRAARTATTVASINQAPVVAVRHLFAPDDVHIQLGLPKTDRSGVGFEQEHLPNPVRVRLQITSGRKSTKHRAVDSRQPRRKAAQLHMDDAESDEEFYDLGPKISYTRHASNKKRAEPAKAVATNQRRWSNDPLEIHKVDEASGLHSPLDGYRPAIHDDRSGTRILMHTSPSVPTYWKASPISVRQLMFGPGGVNLQQGTNTTVTSRPSSILEGSSRVKPTTLEPGKSVFTYITSASRDKLAAVSGNNSLPTGKSSHLPDNVSTLEQQRLKLLQDSSLDPNTAAAALARDKGFGGPYVRNESKKRRYQEYLAFQAGNISCPYPMPSTMSLGDLAAELKEFHSCAMIFRPMSAFMESRFTTPGLVLAPENSSHNASLGTAAESLFKSPDPASEAALTGFFGSLTRSIQKFHPASLLRRRFNLHKQHHQQNSKEMDISEGQLNFNKESCVHTNSLAILPVQKREEPTADEETRMDGKKASVNYQNVFEKNRPHEALFREIFGTDE